MSERPSIPAYVDSLNLEQLRCLVEMANKRITTKTEASWTRYWEVCDDILVIGRYAIDDFESARRRAIRFLEETKADDIVELSIRKGRCPPDEAADYITGDM
jgi:hypothetical protein